VNDKIDNIVASVETILNANPGGNGRPSSSPINTELKQKGKRENSNVLDGTSRRATSHQVMTPIGTRSWAEFEEEWRGWVSGWVADRESSDAPAAWWRLVERPTVDALDAIWDRVQLPKFRRYLNRAFIDARIARTSLGLMLVYHLALWEEQGIEGYVEGFLMAGLPAEQSLIDGAESTFGPLPETLKQLWGVHSFVQLRDTSFLVSPNPAHHQLTTAPLMLGVKQDESKPDLTLECLGIASCSSALVLSITRPPGTQGWNDRLKLAERWGAKMGEPSPTTLDELLGGREYWLTELLRSEA
jgi:hypothetical protein